MITLTTYQWVPDFAAPLMRAFRVRWALEEAGLPYNVRTVALGPEQRSPEHLARQPFGRVAIGITVAPSPSFGDRH